MTSQITKLVIGFQIRHQNTHWLFLFTKVFCKKSFSILDYLSFLLRLIFSSILLLWTLTERGIESMSLLFFLLGFFISPLARSVSLVPDQQPVYLFQHLMGSTVRSGEQNPGIASQTIEISPESLTLLLIPLFQSMRTHIYTLAQRLHKSKWRTLLFIGSLIPL